jgi:hypothetical protein
VLAGCATQNGHARSPRAERWFQRASGEFHRVELDAAHDSVRHALDLVPEDVAVRMLAARIALARLELDEVLRLLRGLPGSEASSLRGRALWYKADLERAADELEQLLADPEVSDPWAKAINRLAREGAGRRPFEIVTTEGRIAAVQMARVTTGAPIYVVPVEVDGDDALALVSTGNAEVVVDSATRREPGWVSLRFGGRLEVRDVPALTQDMSAISKQLGAPIKVLLGVHLLRRLNATIDFRGRQFAARAFAPPPPPGATRVDPFYLRGGGMVVGSFLGDGDGARASLFVDSSMGFAVVLDREGWRKLGVNPTELAVLPDGGGPEMRSGPIALLQLGAFKLSQVPGVFGPPIEKVERELDVDVDGAIGAGLLGAFRITFSEGGRVLWVEQAPRLPPPPALPSAEDLVQAGAALERQPTEVPSPGLPSPGLAPPLTTPLPLPPQLVPTPEGPPEREEEGP